MIGSSVLDTSSHRAIGRPNRPALVRTVALLLVGAGILRTIIGIGAAATVRSQLVAEKIVVPDRSRRYAGRTVSGPLTAFEEARVVGAIALETTGGRTYGEMDEDDPLAQMAMEAALIRSSLFTSILAFSMAAGEAALGALLVAIGAALWSLVKRVPTGPS